MLDCGSTYLPTVLHVGRVTDDHTEPPPQQDSDLQDVLTEHWSSIRSHVARGPVQT